MTHEQRVANGIALLDEHHPGWDTFIDLDRLDIENAYRCICGQLEQHGFFEEDWGVFEKHGNERGIMGTNEGDYRKLTVEWKKAIKKRREGATRERREELVPA